MRLIHVREEKVGHVVTLVIIEGHKLITSYITSMSLSDKNANVTRRGIAASLWELLPIGCFTNYQCWQNSEPMVSDGCTTSDSQQVLKAEEEGNYLIEAAKGRSQSPGSSELQSPLHRQFSIILGVSQVPTILCWSVLLQWHNDTAGKRSH